MRYAYGSTSSLVLTLLLSTSCGGDALEASATQGTQIDAPPEPSVAAEAEDPAPQPEADQTPAVNAFVTAAHDPFSTFGADVDTASYDMFRQYVSANALPPAAWVRVEDFVNFFKYDYEAPAADAEHPFAIHLTQAPHPMDRGTELLRVGIQGALAEAQDKKPANLVFLVDVSGSMSDPDKLPLVKVLLRKTLNVLAPTDTISLVTYAGDSSLALPPTAVENRVAIEKVISKLETGGSTNGQGGLQLAYEQAQKSMVEGGVNHVLLCTDGDFNVGISDPKELADFISQKRDSGVTLTAIGFGKSRSGDEQMEQLSNHGDGIYAVVYDEDQAAKYANERLLSTLVRIAKDMKIQVEFNPTHVRAYRLLGYENRDIPDEDFRNDLVDAGDIGAGHRVTALYEIVRVGKEVPMPKGAPPLKDGSPKAGEREIGEIDLARVKVRYKQPGALSTDPAREVVETLVPDDVLGAVEAADDDFRWAAAMATLAEILRASPFAATSELPMIESLTDALGTKDADHAELVSILPRVAPLMKSR